MYEKVSTMFIITLCIAGQLASCGEGKSATDTDTAEFEPDVTSFVETKEYVKPDVDYGGKTITIPSYKYEGVCRFRNTTRRRKIISALRTHSSATM